jgi:putative inorganic carbon (HCO3(-)) transporter
LTKNLLDKIIEISLFFIFIFVPLIVNPTAYDYFYKPKIESVYALILIICICWFIRGFVVVRSLAWKKNPLSLPLLMYALICVISTITSIDPHLSLKGDVLREEGLIALLSYSALVFLMGNVIRSRELGTRLLKGLALATAILSLYGLIQYFGYNPTAHFIYKSPPGRVSSTMGNPNFLGKYLALTIPLLLVFYLQSKEITMKILFAAGSTCAFSCLILTYSRGSWIGFCFGLLSLLFLLQRFAVAYRLKELLVLGVLFFLAMVFFNLYRPNIEGIEAPRGEGMIVHRALSSREVSSGIGVATRLFVWKKALLLIAQRPWFGYGPETFEKAFRPYNLEYAKKFNDYVRVDRIHNNYLDLAFAIGVLGLSAYFLILLVFFLSLLRSFGEDTDQNWRMLSIGILSGCVGYLVNDLFIFSVVSVSPTFWSLIGLALALRGKEWGEV